MTTSPFRPNPPEHPGDRETLSALLDGELRGDAARFAHRRLEHDADWRATAGRWQLIGDVLRGQPVAIAEPGFAARVAAQVASGRAGSAAAPRAARRLWPWAGGAALAASLLVAAWVGMRPPASAPGDAADAPATPLAAAAPRPQTPTATTRAPETVAAPPARATLPEAPERTLAAAPAEPAPRARPTRPARPVGAPVERRAAEAAALARLERTAPNPFNAPPVEPAARPWPRSTLPPLSAGESAMNASFGRSSRYYPFEPRLPEGERERTVATPATDGR